MASTIAMTTMTPLPTDAAPTTQLSPPMAAVVPASLLLTLAGAAAQAPLLLVIFLPPLLLLLSGNRRRGPDTADEAPDLLSPSSSWEEHESWGGIGPDCDAGPDDGDASEEAIESARLKRLALVRGCLSTARVVVAGEAGAELTIVPHGETNDDDGDSASAGARPLLRHECCAICLEAYEEGDAVSWAAVRQGTRNDGRPEGGGGGGGGDAASTDGDHGCSGACSGGCDHVFHESCIVSWLASSQDRNDCPLCRGAIVFVDNDPAA